MLSTQQKFQKAIMLFDELNSQDPNQEEWQNHFYPKELLYAQRMTACLHKFAPHASEALQLAARCQHLCRWEIPRSDYPMGRKGYHQWRSKLKILHAEKAAAVLETVGYDNTITERVQFLVLKKQLKRDAATQVLEDVICLVFLKHYLMPFAIQHQEEKVISILQKTWRKMSKKGQEAALQLPLEKSAIRLLERALK